jgi:hypothetical protein
VAVFKIHARRLNDVAEALDIKLVGLDDRCECLCNRVPRLVALQTLDLFGPPIQFDRPNPRLAHIARDG